MQGLRSRLTRASCVIGMLTMLCAVPVARDGVASYRDVGRGFGAELVVVPVVYLAVRFAEGRMCGAGSQEKIDPNRCDGR